MKPTNEQIAEIAEWLECGMTCYFHRPTGEIEYHPNDELLYMDEEPWEEILNRIEEDRDNYDRFEKMESRQEFGVMEDFANSLSDEPFRERIFEHLSRRKPFRNFKALIDSSKYRQDWFDFRTQAYIDFVKWQMENQ